MDGLPGYDAWKLASPPYEDEPDPVLYCVRCGYSGDPDEFEVEVDDGEGDEREVSIENLCPKCHSGSVEDAGEHDERLRDQYWQQKLDERLGK